MNELTEIDIVRYRDGKLTEAQDPIAVEATLTFVVNGHEIAALMSTPTQVEAFTYGFLFTSGIISCARDIESWHLDETQWQVEVTVRDFSGPSKLGKAVSTPGFGKGVIYPQSRQKSPCAISASHTGVSARALIRAMEWLIHSSDLHKKTGGVHTAAVSKGNAMPEWHIDDIGRHNAVDKVIGTLVMKETSADNLVLLGTGRISSEILQKAAQMGIPVLASRGAPTRKTVETARQMGITVVGFVRSDNFAVFSHPHRIILP